jgi:hypothetical protein
VTALAERIGVTAGAILESPLPAMHEPPLMAVEAFSAYGMQPPEESTALGVVADASGHVFE